MNINGDSVAILFSGGTDSTLTAALLQESFSKVFLITYNRFGFHSADNTKTQAELLKNKFGEDKFVHVFINVDKLFKFLSYENYLQNIIKHGFFNLSTCGLCKLSMHARTIKYCLDNDIRYVADGANQAMNMEPAQMKPVIDAIKQMYDHFGIIYFNPVFEMDGPEDKGFIEKENLSLIQKQKQGLSDEKANTPGNMLYKMGLAPAPNIKGSDYDRKRQPRCFQFIVFNIFAIKYFLDLHSYDEYEKMTLAFYKDKIKKTTMVLEKKFDKKSLRLME